MTRLCWITDPHLNFLPSEPTLRFATEPWFDAIDEVFELEGMLRAQPERLASIR